MIEQLKISIASKTWFWSLRAWLQKIAFFFERTAYAKTALLTKAEINGLILGSFFWIGVKSLFWVFLFLAMLNYVESLVAGRFTFMPSLSSDDREFNIEQLRLYGQLLTAIFSIYFATVGIILSSGYTRLRRDIIQMLTNEQVGSVYSKVLVLSAIFCLLATALPSFGFNPGILVYTVGTILMLLSALALFPLGQRLFNFFDLNQLIHSELLPSLVRDIKYATNPRNSISLANHHSKAARRAIEQLSYIDSYVKADRVSLKYNLPALTDDYTFLLQHYVRRKHTIDQNSYWFPRRIVHKQWFLAGDMATSSAMNTRSQQLMVEERPDYEWLEKEIASKLVGHFELALGAGDLALALKLIDRFSIRASSYAEQLQFEDGMRELTEFKQILVSAFDSINDAPDEESSKAKIGLADTWATFGSNLCLETLRRMLTFEKELQKYFDADDWSRKSLRNLPAFLQVELAPIVKRIEFEMEVEGRRLSKPRYLQQLAIQKLLRHYSKILPSISHYFEHELPEFVEAMTQLRMSKAATQVVLSSLHTHWKLASFWLDEVANMVERYKEYQHYSEEHYRLPEIDISEMIEQLSKAREDAISSLGNPEIVGHIFDAEQDDDLPDHFGQIYFELAEACINAIEQNDEHKLDKVFPMFFSLAILAADSKFPDPSLKVNDEFRLHLISSVINDLASVLGFAILYGAYFGNEKLSEDVLQKFHTLVEKATNKQKYLKRMLLLSDLSSFSMSASPRGLIRINWKMAFEHQAREDGYADQMMFSEGKQHSNVLVREFLSSLSDASHLFFAKEVLPNLDIADFKVDHRITSLARRLNEDGDGDE
ncbi:hypothetical protein [Marinobacter sp. ATCH36]|uniref:hypothetical protein n=1 Tax=Marinobacter sp. ATCH36 TaxID=2945106 RepID=UPI0020214B5A|nr:hypothetical protein [Marinobacter sp. ATCH36]MCL7944669.1 hypothetical protein [Marinobacter sp. ATCH36]